LLFYISNRTDNETETNRGRRRAKRVRAGRGVPRDRLGFVFLETLTNPKQDIAAAVRRPKQRETRRRLGPAAHRTERKAAERRKNKGNTMYPATINTQARKFNNAKIERKCKAKRGVGIKI
jgi:hypothetical protein